MKERRTDFYWSETEHQHQTRARAMLAAHGPEIRALMGVEWRTKYIVVALVAAQIWLALQAPRMSWLMFFGLAYAVGGSITNILFLANHEITHNLAFHSLWMNNALAYVCNLPIPVPFAMMFKTHHADHHHYLGWDGVDSDVPTPLEARLLNNVVGKVIFITFQVLFYALRPCVIRSVVFEREHIINYVIQFSFDIVVVYFCGVWPMLFFLASCILGTGWHPLAGHFLAEHFVLANTGTDQDTFSYYGWLNNLMWNSGYHTEHHDIPNIPWSRIKRLREIAPEFYDHLVETPSWPGALWAFLTTPGASSYARVKRERGANKRPNLLPTQKAPHPTGLPYSGKQPPPTSKRDALAKASKKG